jgi:hypothetical protein
MAHSRLILLALLLIACSQPPSVDPDPTQPINVTITPKSVVINQRATQQFQATVTGGRAASDVRWETNGGAVNFGTYIAPGESGEYIVRAVSLEDPTKSATATVTVRCGPADRGRIPERGKLVESLGGRPGRVRALLERSDGSLIAAGYGVFRLASSSAQIGVWERVGARAAEDEFFAVVEAFGTLYARSKSGVERLDPVSDTWQAFGSSLAATSYPDLARGSEGNIYVTGPLPGGLTNTVYRLDRPCGTPEPVSGLGGTQEIYRLKNDSAGRVYAATNDGVYMLAPGENVFRALPRTGLPLEQPFAVTDFLFESGSVWATGGRGVYRLDSGAVTWRMIGIAPDEYFYPQRLIRRADGDLIARNGSTLYRLVGEHWVSATSNNFSADFDARAIVEHNSELYIATASGVQVVGAITTLLNTRGIGERGLPGPPDVLAADAVGTLYASFNGLGIYFKPRSSTNWSPLALPANTRPREGFVVTPAGTVYFVGLTYSSGTNSDVGVFARGADAAWTNIGRPSFLRDLRLGPDSTVYALREPFDGGGIARWVNGSWLIERPMPGTRFSDLAFSATGDVYASINMIGQSQTPSRGVFRRDAVTGQWASFNTGLGDRPVMKLEIDSQGALYALSDGNVYRRASGASSWTLIQTQERYAALIAIDPLDRLVFSLDRFVYRGVNASTPAFETPEGGPVLGFARGVDALFGIDASGVFRLP